MPDRIVEQILFAHVTGNLFGAHAALAADALRLAIGAAGEPLQEDLVSDLVAMIGCEG